MSIAARQPRSHKLMSYHQPAVAHAWPCRPSRILSTASEAGQLPQDQMAWLLLWACVTSPTPLPCSLADFVSDTNFSAPHVLRS